jgi:hypothetical protein
MIVITGPSMCDGGHIDISKYISWNFLHFTFFFGERTRLTSCHEMIYSILNKSTLSIPFFLSLGQTC